MAYVMMIVCGVFSFSAFVVAMIGFFLLAKCVFSGSVENNKTFKYFIMFGGGNIVAVLFGIATTGCAIWAGIANYSEIVKYFNQ